MRLVSDWATSLRISPRTCTRRAYSRSDVDCTCGLLVPRLFVWWIIMSSYLDLLAVNQAGAATSASTPLPGTFLGLALDFVPVRLSVWLCQCRTAVVSEL